jgi:hypothetical protein
MSDDSIQNRGGSARPLPKPSVPPVNIPRPPRSRPVPSAEVTPAPAATVPTAAAEPETKADPPPWAKVPASTPPPPAVSPVAASSPAVSSPVPAPSPALSATATPAVSAPPAQVAAVPERTLSDQMDDLERWALGVQRRIRLEEWRAVLVRTGALACVLGAAVVVHHGRTTLGALLAALCALLMIVETAWPGLSSGRSVRQQAVNDLRELQHGAKLQWDRIRLTHADSTGRERAKYAVALLQAVRTRREQIARRLVGIEPSPPIGKGAL